MNRSLNKKIQQHKTNHKHKKQGTIKNGVPDTLLCDILRAPTIRSMCLRLSKVQERLDEAYNDLETRGGGERYPTGLRPVYRQHQ